MKHDAMTQALFTKKAETTQTCFGLIRLRNEVLDASHGAACGSISSRMDNKNEREPSLSSSYALPFSLLGVYGEDLSLRRTRCSCFPRDA